MSLRRIDRPLLERARVRYVRRLAKWLGIDARGPNVAERVARHLAEKDMNNSWPPRALERRW